MEREQLDRLCITTLRMLAVDMVEAAGSGHPGLPLGAAPMAWVLWSRFLRHNPADPAWPGRDRFVLSAGHGSALLYGLLFLHGYELTLEDLKAFRQWGSRTPGHPEYGLTPGVEVTTGPLGQGLAHAVGMAMAQRFLAGRFHRPGHRLLDHWTYVLASDGDLMEGISYEAASLAGTLGLERLVCLWDDNRISIEGDTALAFTEDVTARFRALGWQVLSVEDGEDRQAIAAAIEQARAEDQRPSFIRVRTHIGYGSPKADSPACHGEPLGPEAVAATRRFYGWPDEPFHVPPQTADYTRRAREEGARRQAQWEEALARYREEHPREAAELERWLAGELPSGWREVLPRFSPQDGPLATRVASGKALAALAGVVGNLVGGSADLGPSNKTVIPGEGDMRGRGADCGRNIHFGVREHAMAAAVNGMALHGGLVPYCGTFFVFADYMRPALRLAALMGCPSIFVFSHDSIGVGEDGPTHQPVEQLMSLRLIPGLSVFRPADANEAAVAWELALSRRRPFVMVLTRQKVPVLDPRLYPLDQARRGGYVLSPEGGSLDIVLMASGSEVHLALEAQRLLARRGVGCRVVSLPSWEVFAEQDAAYRDTVLPPEAEVRLAVEAGVSLGWERWVGPRGAVVGMDRFGVSAPGAEVMARMGFTPQTVAERALQLLSG